MKATGCRKLEALQKLLSIAHAEDKAFLSGFIDSIKDGGRWPAEGTLVGAARRRHGSESRGCGEGVPHV